MTEAAVNLIESLDALLESGIDYKMVPLPNGKGAVRIGTISAGDLIEYNELRGTADGRRWSGPVLISRSLVDKDGNRTGVLTPFADMSEEEKTKVGALRRLAMPVSEAIIRAIFDLNGVSLVQREEAKNESGAAPTNN